MDPRAKKGCMTYVVTLAAAELRSGGNRKLQAEIIGATKNNGFAIMVHLILQSLVMRGLTKL